MCVWSSSKWSISLPPLKLVPSVTWSHVSMVYVCSQSPHSPMLQELQKQAFNLFQICRAELSELLIEWNYRVPCTVFTQCFWDRSTFVTYENILHTRCFLVACSPMIDAHHFTIDAASWRRAPVNFISSLRREFFMHVATPSCSPFPWPVSN